MLPFSIFCLLCSNSHYCTCIHQQLGVNLYALNDIHAFVPPNPEVALQRGLTETPPIYAQLHRPPLVLRVEEQDCNNNNNNNNIHNNNNNNSNYNNNNNNNVLSENQEQKMIKSDEARLEKTQLNAKSRSNEPESKTTAPRPRPRPATTSLLSSMSLVSSRAVNVRWHHSYTSLPQNYTWRTAINVLLVALCIPLLVLLLRKWSFMTSTSF
jgi:hypothetical protein